VCLFCLLHPVPAPFFFSIQLPSASSLLNQSFPTSLLWASFKIPVNPSPLALDFLDSHTLLVFSLFPYPPFDDSTFCWLFFITSSVKVLATIPSWGCDPPFRCKPFAGFLIFFLCLSAVDSNELYFVDDAPFFFLRPKHDCVFTAVPWLRLLLTLFPFMVVGDFSLFSSFSS